MAVTERRPKPGRPRLAEQHVWELRAGDPHTQRRGPSGPRAWGVGGAAREPSGQVRGRWTASWGSVEPPSGPLSGSEVPVETLKGPPGNGWC